MPDFLDSLLRWVQFFAGIGVIAFMAFYNHWLKKHYQCSAVAIGGIAAGFLDMLLWFGFMNCEGFFWHLILLVLAGFIFFAMYALNFEKCGENLLQGFLMTVWQLLTGFLILGFVVMLFAERDYKKKK